MPETPKLRHSFTFLYIDVSLIVLGKHIKCVNILLIYRAVEQGDVLLILAKENFRSNIRS